jgi:hypothetical protein
VVEGHSARAAIYVDHMRCFGAPGTGGPKQREGSDMGSLNRLVRSLILSVIALLLITSSALADSPHQVGQTSVTVSGNSLTISASIAGLGNASSATFDLGGSVDVFSRCYNRGGNKPQADNKQETISVSQTQTFPVRNGRTNATFTVTPLSTLTCPGNQQVVIESFSYDLSISYQGNVLVHAAG